VEIIVIGLTALLCALTYALYRVAAGLQEHE
jgi:hypothetical protein